MNLNQHDIAAGLVPYLQGCIPQAEEILLVLDALAIADYNAMPEAINIESPAPATSFGLGFKASI